MITILLTCGLLIITNVSTVKLTENNFMDFLNQFSKCPKSMFVLVSKTLCSVNYYRPFGFEICRQTAFLRNLWCVNILVYLETRVLMPNHRFCWFVNNPQSKKVHRQDRVLNSRVHRYFDPARHDPARPYPFGLKWIWN